MKNKKAEIYMTFFALLIWILLGVGIGIFIGYKIWGV